MQSKTSPNRIAESFYDDNATAQLLLLFSVSRLDLHQLTKKLVPAARRRGGTKKRRFFGIKFAVAAD
jgi:hypothetical protein